MRRRLSLTAALTVPVLLLAGCSSDDDGNDASSAEPSGGATTETASATPSSEGSETSEASPSPTGSAGGTPSDGESVDPAEFAQRLRDATEGESGYRMTIEQELGGQSSTTEAQVDQSSDTPAIAMTATGGMAPGEVEVRIVDERVFLRGEGLTPDGGWAGSEPDGQDPFSQVFSSMSEQFESAGTPENFEETAQEVTYVGTEDVDGETLEHYRVVVDGQAAMANLQSGLGQGAGASGGASAAPSEMPSDMPSGMASVPETIEQHIYLDEQGRTRRIEQSTDQVTTTITVDDWGETFDISAPPEDEVTPFSEMQGAMGGGAAGGGASPAATPSDG